MELKKTAMAGSFESCDIHITLRPNPGNGIEIALVSDVEAIFGEAIRKTIVDTLIEFDVKDAYMHVVDKGAIDCVIKSRMQCVICRAAEVKYDWSRENECKE